MELAAGAVQRNGDQHLRHVEQMGDLRIGEVFEVAQGEDFGGAGVEGSEGAAQAVAHFGGRRGAAAHRLGERNGGRGATAADQIEGGVDGGAAEVAFLLGQRGDGCVAAQQAQEDGLQNVFGIGGVADDAVCGAEDQPVVFLEDLAEFRAVRKDRNLSGY